MGLFDRVFKKKSSTFTWQGSDTTASYSAYYGRENILLDMTNQSNAIKALRECPILSFALLTRSDAMKNAVIDILDSKGDYAKGVDADKIKALLTKPNDYETWDSLRVKADIYRHVFGWAVIYKETDIIGAPAYRAKALHVLNPTELRPVYMNLNVTKLDNALLGFDGNRVGIPFIPLSECMLIKSDVVNPTNRYIPYPTIEPVSTQISNIMVAYEVRNSSMVNRGAVGTITPKTRDLASIMLPKLQGELNSAKEKYYNDYGMTHGKSPLIFSNVPLEFGRINWSVDEMKLYEEVADSGKKVLNQLGVPPILASSGEGTTYANMKEAEKSLYTGTIIPTDAEFYEHLTGFMGIADRGWSIQSFYDHVEVLQEGEKEKAEARKATIEANLPLYEKNIITLNQLLTALEYDTIPEGDKYMRDVETQRQPQPPASGTNE